MKRIELDKIIAAKSPALARRLPDFVVRSLEKLIRQQRINYVLDNFSNLSPLEFIDATLNTIGINYTLHNTQNIPTDGKLLFAANHPLGGIDGLILARGVSNFRDVKLIVNDILMNIEPLRPLFVPVNKHGAQHNHNALAQRELYGSESAIVTFPAGLCSRLINGEITDPPWKRNFVVKSAESSRLIIPTYVKGRNSTLFYKTALWRKRLKISANLEMILLPKEMFDSAGSHIDIYFGTPIQITDAHNIEQWVEIVRQKTYELGINN